MKGGWGSDVPVSMPVPPDQRPTVRMGGFGFGPNGICHDITSEERDEIAAPTYAPFNPIGGG